MRVTGHTRGRREEGRRPSATVERSRPHGRSEHSLTIQKPVSDSPRTPDRALGAHGLIKPCVPCTHGEEIPTMPPFGMPTVGLRRESYPDVEQVRCDHGFGGISLIPLVRLQLVSWTVGEAPEIPDRRQMPSGMIATAEAVMILPTPGDGGHTSSSSWRIRPCSPRMTFWDRLPRTVQARPPGPARGESARRPVVNDPRERRALPG
jgi:hypothetical protein